MSESMSPLSERSQLETLENLGKAPLENSAFKQEDEVTSGLTSNRKEEISGQGKQVDVHDSGQLEHTGSLASSSKTPLLRYLLNNILSAFFPYWGFYILFPLSITRRAVLLLVTYMAKSYSICPLQQSRKDQTVHFGIWIILIIKWADWPKDTTYVWYVYLDTDRCLLWDWHPLAVIRI